MKTSLGAKIELLQAEQGMSNVTLARKLGKKPQNIPRLKRTENPRKNTIQKLSRAFAVPVSHFFDLDASV